MLCVRVLFAPGANGHSEDKKKNVGKQEKGDRVQKWCENRKVSHGQRERQKPNLDWMSAFLRITSWSGMCLWECVCDSQNADSGAEA